MHLRYQFCIIIVGVCSSHSLATRWGTRNLIYILVFILLLLLLTILISILIFLLPLFDSILTLLFLSSSSPNNSNSNGFYSQSWTCLGWNKNKVNLVWAMFGYYWAYMVAIGKKLQANDKLIRWLPPFSLIRDFRKQNTRGNVSKISVNHACYRQIGSKSTNHSH